MFGYQRFPYVLMPVEIGRRRLFTATHDLRRDDFDPVQGMLHQEHVSYCPILRLHALYYTGKNLPLNRSKR